MKLLNSRIPIEEALKDPKIPDADKKKLELAQKARAFAENDLHLKPTQNYTSYVKLDRPYATYVVSAAYKWELKHYQWSYPILGKMPYKGYFNEQDAKAEAQEMQKEDLDTYMRGVTAYSTLGWFKDPLLSSMLSYKDYDLVNTIIHETVHATLYIKGNADFNESLASFLGNKGAEQYYLKEEGANSPTLAQIKKDNEDDKIFSKFISQELKELATWYKNLPTTERVEEKRMARIQAIQEKFKKEVLPTMHTKNYEKFTNAKLNNARLLVYKTYLQDLADFETLYQQSGKNFQIFIERCKALEGEKDPAKKLKELIGTKSENELSANNPSAETQQDQKKKESKIPTH
ncbi:aminopeptidase [Bdellovibrio sp. SKB1291214]|uniref:aminopeptidase n=1 Tax=Bdellovibrio sp. SKB1291214 TaxID=1732569 RepID=UPI00223F256E|nr:aminopeptidase [Bdellovibrio sp. SKB1291214]UYL09036.1 aminopeptidase [Bdellovibrio sp. SKB1291214]